MKDSTRQKLEHERSVGEMHQRAWVNSVKPFVDLKQAELYLRFLDHPTSDKEGLMLIKLQTNAITSMADEFQSFINTGKLASTQLNEESNDGK